MNSLRAPVMFGAADGLTLAVGLLVSLGWTEPHALWHAAIGAGLAELVGMGAGQWLSQPEAGLLSAAANGAAALAACLAPAVPFLAGTGPVVLGCSAGVAVIAAGLIAVLRPEHGWAAVMQTYGVLGGAALLCVLASLT